MKKLTLSLITTLALAGTTILAPVAYAETGKHGCQYGSSMDGHGVYSTCPYSAPIGKHEGFAKMWFNSGYSDTIRTWPTSPGLKGESGYYYGGKVFQTWQKYY